MEKNENIQVFAYGSLRHPQFVRDLFGKTVEMIPAKLENYRRVHLHGKKYPLAIKESNAVIKGELLQNLTMDDLKKIERWEKTPERLYKRIEVDVKTKKGGMKAFAYVTDKKTLENAGFIYTSNKRTLIKAEH